MKSLTTRQPRRIAVIFWIMTALFVAQMTWWIFFQVANVPGDIAALERSLQYQRYEAAEHWRLWSDQLADSLRTAWASSQAQRFIGGSVGGSLPKWRWMGIEGEVGRLGYWEGTSKAHPIGCLVIPIVQNDVIVHFSRDAIREWLASEYPALRYEAFSDSADPRFGRMLRDVSLRDALSISELSVDSATADQVLEGRRGRVRMFVSEGIFFLLLILVGAVSIHRALRQSAALERQQQNFLAAVTHELKSPLASIRLFSETVSARELSDVKRREVMDKITQDAVRLEEMVDDVLEATTLSRETYHPQLVDTDLSTAIQSYSEIYRPRAERAGIRWQTQIEPGLRARTDYRHLRRAVGAVLDNAIKYSQHVAGDKSIQLSLTRSDSEAIITVTDRGVGLSPVDLKRVFERFFRAGDEMTRRVAGSGLGLYLVREIVDAHGGQVMARSDGPAKGTTIEIHLPLLTA